MDWNTGAISRDITSSSFVCHLALALMILVISSSCARRPSPEQQLQASESTLLWLVDRHGEVVDREAASYATNLALRLNDAAIKLFGASPPSEAALHYLSNPQVWRIAILKTGESNAFSVGSGIIVVTRSLVENLTSEAAFAAVLAHEMSHHYLGHTDAALERARKSAAKERASNSDSSAVVVSPVATHPTFHLDEAEELHADSLAFKLLTYAGYDPRHSLGSLVTLSRSRGMSDYSSLMKDRIQQLGMLADEILMRPLPATNREFVRFRRTVLQG